MTGDTEREFDHILTPDEMQDMVAHGVTIIEFGDVKLRLRDGFSNSSRSVEPDTDKEELYG